MSFANHVMEAIRFNSLLQALRAGVLLRLTYDYGTTKLRWL